MGTIPEDLPDAETVVSRFDERWDAILTTVQAAHRATSDIFAQRYRFVDGELTEAGNAKHIAIDRPPLMSR